MDLVILGRAEGPSDCLAQSNGWVQCNGWVNEFINTLKAKGPAICLGLHPRVDVRTLAVHSKHALE